ncbi:hypothetical protein AMS68_002273 [Peltaster fructicola]|uniref:NACHT domain-containing protein n=1 Tax=Peltaster fructicola TaxID=286661 RepID=A0A6H0XPZ1_9PEZI|nr:hypothetical protein AMS68_002273 [Peltaster fructicola]
MNNTPSSDKTDGSHLEHTGSGPLNTNLGAGGQENYTISGGSHNQQIIATHVNIDSRHREIQKEIADWLSPSDPWTNHSTARRQHEAGTGEWLLRSPQYKRWKSDVVSHSWLYGKPGCGKTVLCSTVIEDLRQQCRENTNIGLAVFYFSFTDEKKQNYDSLLRSLVAQLASKEPASSALRQAYEKPYRTIPTTEVLEQILNLSLEPYSRVFIAIDALDECPGAGNARKDVLDALERFITQTPKLRLFMTSRDLSDIRLMMQDLEVQQIAAATLAVDKDIRRYLCMQLQGDRRLARFKPDLKMEIERTISSKADGMFRWAFLQLEELKKLKVLQPSFVRKALNNMPLTLDDTYERILRSIEPDYQGHAMKLLRWLTYAKDL